MAPSAGFTSSDKYCNSPAALHLESPYQRAFLTLPTRRDEAGQKFSGWQQKFYLCATVQHLWWPRMNSLPSSIPPSLWACVDDVRHYHIQAYLPSIPPLQIATTGAHLSINVAGIGTGAKVATATATGAGAAAVAQSLHSFLHFPLSVFSFQLQILQFSQCAVICHLLGGFMFHSLTHCCCCWSCQHTRRQHE